MTNMSLVAGKCEM